MASDGKNKKIAAMVSGGIDSMVMLDVLCGQFDLIVVHVNHGIRKEADEDEQFVRSYCCSRKLEFRSYKFDVPALAAQNGRSIETEARIARKDVIKELLSEVEAVALAHHARDNAETVLMHILRGCGIDGLRGMEQTDRILRPLLKWSKEQINEYAYSHKIPFVTDNSNFDVKYTRNFIRLEVLPLIEQRYPGAVAALNRLAENAISTTAAMDALMDESLISIDGDSIGLSLKAFDSSLKDRYITTAIKKIMPVDVTKTQIDSVMALVGCRNGSKAELANGLKAYREYDRITFCFDSNKSDAEIPFKEGIVDFGEKQIEVIRVPGVPIKGQTIVCSDLPDSAVFRHRRRSDRFVPYGGKGKSLGDYLTDKKVPLRHRDNLICLCDGSDVLAIVGMEISDKVKLNGGNGYLLRIKNDNLTKEKI